MGNKYITFIRSDCETLIPFGVYDFYCDAERALRDRLSRYDDCGYIVDIYPDNSTDVFEFRVDNETGFKQVAFLCPDGHNPLEWL